jgi:hypothetical protein
MKLTIMYASSDLKIYGTRIDDLYKVNLGSQPVKPHPLRFLISWYSWSC